MKLIKRTYESEAYLEMFAKVYFTGGKVENSTVLILRKRCLLLTCRKITFSYKDHCYCWENVQKVRSPDSLTYGRQDKTRTFILFSKILRNNCIERYSLQHSQRRRYHLNNRNTSDAFVQGARAGNDLFKRKPKYAKRTPRGWIVFKREIEIERERERQRERKRE